MYKRKASFAKTNIFKALICLKEFEPRLFKKTFKQLGVKGVVLKHLNESGIDTLSTLYSSLDILDIVYSEDGNQLMTLYRNIKKICDKHLFFNVSNAVVDYEKEKFVSVEITIHKAKPLNNNKTTVNPKKKTIAAPTSNSFLSKFYNYNNAKKYSQSFFEKEFKPFICGKIPGFKHHKVIKVVLKGGFIFNAYSEEERAFLRKLEKEKDIAVIRGGNYGITVSSNDEVLYTYYPDIYIQTTDGKIGFIEVKPLYDMADKDVLDKWDMLKQYCRNNGFMCFIGNRVFSSYNELRNKKIPQSLIEAVRREVRTTGEFNYGDYNMYKSSVKTKRRELDVALSAFCYTRHYTFETNKYGLRRFRITKE